MCPCSNGQAYQVSQALKADDPVMLQDWYKKHLGIDVQDRGGAEFHWVDG